MLPVPLDPPTIALLEQLIDAAWPAEEQEALGPWKLRFTHGFSSRGNSVLPVFGPLAQVAGMEALELVRLIKLVEDFFAYRQQSAVFHLSPAAYPADLDALLSQRGYELFEPAHVLVAPADVVQLAAAAPDVPVRLSSAPSAPWIALAFDDPLASRYVRKRLAWHGEADRIFASIERQGRVLATALAIRARPPARWTGIYCMSTHPDFRRQGLARALLRTIGAWSLSGGNPDLYLQVHPDNHPARQLYQACGFILGYECHLRRQPDVVAGAAPTGSAQTRAVRGGLGPLKID